VCNHSVVVVVSKLNILNVSAQSVNACAVLTEEEMEESYRLRTNSKYEIEYIVHRLLKLASIVISQKAKEDLHKNPFDFEFVQAGNKLILRLC
jgi:hypothetical protein